MALNLVMMLLTLTLKLKIFSKKINTNSLVKNISKT